jgi:hypothetical protein
MLQHFYLRHLQLFSLSTLTLVVNPSLQSGSLAGLRIVVLLVTDDIPVAERHTNTTMMKNEDFNYQSSISMTLLVTSIISDYALILFCIFQSYLVSHNHEVTYNTSKTAPTSRSVDVGFVFQLHCSRRNR